MDQRSSIWPTFIGEDTTTMPIEVPPAEAFDAKVSWRAKDLMESNVQETCHAILLQCPRAAYAYARAAAHWAGVHQRFMGIE